MNNNGNINFTSSAAAVIHGGRELSYSETGNKISAYADSFLSAGISSGDYVGVLLGNSPEFIAAFFGLWKIKAVPVLISTRLTEHEISDILSAGRIRSVVTNNKYSAKPGSDFITINVDQFALQRNSSTDEISFGKTVIFTSGSSGAPKGVVLGPAALISSINAGNSVLKQSPEDRWLASLPFYHIGGLMIILRAFYYGASVILPEQLRLEQIIYCFEHSRPSFASLVPTQLQRMLEAGIKPNNELRILLLGGGSIDQLLVKNALDRGWPVAAVYGSTETASFVAYISPEELKKNPGSSGKAVPPAQIEILDSGVIEGDPSGEIVVQSPSLFEGYLYNPEESSSKLLDGRYFTGDYGILDGGNYLYVMSRRTDMIVSGGENIDPAEVEKAMMQFPGIRDVCVFGRKDDEWGEVVNAAVAADDNFSAEELTKFLRKDLARYKIPKAYFKVEEIPRTPLGKIRREKVKSMFNRQ